jgi:hypothetical protein
MTAFIDQVMDIRSPVWDIIGTSITKYGSFTHETFALYLVSRSVMSDGIAKLALTFLCSHKMVNLNT